MAGTHAQQERGSAAPRPGPDPIPSAGLASRRGTVADPRFAYKLRRIYAATPGAANLRALVVHQDDLRQIPDGAPVYVSRLGRERLDGAPVAGQELAEPRVFSPESARELLAFVVLANMAALAGRASTGLDT